MKSEDFHDESLPWIHISSWLDTLHLFGFQKYQEKDNAFWILYASSLATTICNLRVMTPFPVGLICSTASTGWHELQEKEKEKTTRKRYIFHVSDIGYIYILIMWYRHLLSHWWKWSSKDFYNESHPWIYIFLISTSWFVLIYLISSSLFLLGENEVPRFSH